MSEETFRVPCMCSQEEVAVTFDQDPDWTTLCLAFWQQGHAWPPTWGHRIRHILRVLRKGTPYGDMVILSSGRAQALSDKLAEFAARLAEIEKAKKIVCPGSAYEDPERGKP